MTSESVEMDSAETWMRGERERYKRSMEPLVSHVVPSSATPIAPPQRPPPTHDHVLKKRQVSFERNGGSRMRKEEDAQETPSLAAARHANRDVGIAPPPTPPALAPTATGAQSHRVAANQPVPSPVVVMADTEVTADHKVSFSIPMHDNKKLQTHKYRELLCDEVANKTTQRAPKGRQPLDRAWVLNELSNTGVMSSLIGGFALGSMQASQVEYDFSEALISELVAYLFSIFAVHVCTCSALTSAILYREVNLLHDDAVASWATTNWHLRSVPMVSFTLGCGAHIVSVLAMSYRTLQDEALLRNVACLIGLLSVSTVVTTVFKIGRQRQHMRHSSARDE